MVKILRIAGAASVVALAIFLACSGEQQAGVATVVITVSQRTINSQGQTTQVGVQATDANGKPGVGQVALTATAGFFDSTTLTLAIDGTAGASYRCDATADSRCGGGTVRITATWTPSLGAAPVTASTNITVTSGTNDGGNDGGTDGGTDGGSGGTPDGGNGPLTLTTSKSTIFRGVGDSAVITARLVFPDGGPQSGQLIAFTTNLGAFLVGDGGTVQASVQGTTGPGGTTTATFTETGDAGVATITGTHQASGAFGTVNVSITPVQQITWQSTTCNGQACTIMGLRGSGFNEQAQVTFKVVDSNNNPIGGVAVSFSLTNPPTGTTVRPNGVTDSNGLVTANVSAGGVIGTFTVRAVVVPNQIQTLSPNIGLRGAKPTNRGFQLNCHPVNVAVYAAVNPPADIPVTCDVTLVDRFHNSVGTGTSVNFKSEAGTMVPSVNSRAYPDPNEGTATVTFNTRGTFPPEDVSPFAADAGQWPFPRSAEPSFDAGTIIRNPRDGLVTIIAYLRGEEYFDDNNQNGQWDPGERFFDQGEAFVDANDNGVWDPGEFYIDDSPPNGRYDGPNGVWDGDTTVWTEARVLYTGYPVGDAQHISLSPNPFEALCPGGIEKGGFRNIGTRFADMNLNRPIAGSTIIAAVTRGTVSVGGGGTLSDGYGFGYEQLWVDGTTGTACTETSTRCVTQVNFYDWGGGATNLVTVFGMPFGDTTTCGNANLTVTGTILTFPYSVIAPGGIQ